MMNEPVRRKDAFSNQSGIHHIEILSNGFIVCIGPCGTGAKT